MGFSIKFNWVLQIDPPEVPALGTDYPFQKSGNRVFPLDTPIDLIDPDRTAVAKIKIKSFTNDAISTSGLYEIVKIYRDEEKAVLSHYWIENQ